MDTLAPYFEWPQSGDINTNPAGDVRNDYGWIADGYVYPPETANYKFYIATDDNSEVWLSTDDDPANAVKIASESSWRGIRDYDQDGTAEDGESVSDPIALEAGKPYYIKVLTKEGGGGDNMALAWSIGDAAAPADGSAPIEGKYLAPGSVHPEYTADLALKQLLEIILFQLIFCHLYLINRS